MDINRKEFNIISDVLRKWEESGKLSPEQATDLRNDLSVKQNEHQQIAQYFFIVAVSCAILAFGAIFIDDKILEKLKVYFSLSNFFIAAISIAITTLWFWYVSHIRQKLSRGAFETYLVLGTLLMLISLVYIFKDIGAGPYYSTLLFAATALIFFVGIISKSKIIWTAGILSMIIWYGCLSTWLSKDYLFFGMNYPVRMTALGALITLFAFVQKRIGAIAFSERASFLAGVLLFFSGLWAVSVFGNYGHLDDWANVRQSQVMIYAIIFGICSVIVFYAGIKLKDESLRDIGVLTLLLNLYTRYFEYFWDNTNKGLFFLVLAISFYLAGRFLDKKRRVEATK